MELVDGLWVGYVAFVGISVLCVLKATCLENGICLPGAAAIALDVLCMGGVAFFTTNDVTERLRGETGEIGLDFEGIPRVAFWLGCMAAFVAAVILAGTAIFLLSKLLAREATYELLGLTNAKRTDDIFSFYVLPVVVTGYLGVAACVIWRASAADELDIQGGLDFEAWTTLLVVWGVWCLGQAGVAAFFRSGRKFDTSAFAGAMVPAVVPFLSDTFNSAKDLCFAALAFQSSDKIGQAIGWVSLALVVIVHVSMYLTPGGHSEMKNTYLGVFVVAARYDSMKHDGKGSMADKIGLGLVKQSTPERVNSLILEDAPQGFLAVCFSISSRTLSPFLIGVNIAVPLLRICVAKFLRGYILSLGFVLKGLMRPLFKTSSPEVRRWTLEQLRYSLESNGLTVRKHVDAFATEFLEAHRGSLKLDWLKAMGDQCDQLEMSFATALEANKTLHSLDWAESAIGSNIVTALAKSLEGNTSLQQLDFGRNEIGSEGATALAKALEGNTSLKRLNLCYNGIDSEGATALAKALEGNTSLQRLDLWNNEIRSDGATALAKVLEVNTSLKVLDLSSNDIEDEGAIALAELLTGGKYSKALEELNLARNYIGEVGKNALKEAEAAVRARGGRPTITF